MEYLVTMTTRVPAGTADDAVQQVRDREAARSRELAAEGSLHRLWRPPLQPGEWRSLGLFSAADEAELDRVLKSMPLRIWRTDDVTPLLPHHNDPHPGDADAAAAADRAEFLTTFTVEIPPDAPAQAVSDAEAGESARTSELAREGSLLRLWMLDDHSRALGLWAAPDPEAMQAALTSLPLDQWMTVQTTPLTAHPSDPVRATRAG